MTNSIRVHPSLQKALPKQLLPRSPLASRLITRTRPPKGSEGPPKALKVPAPSLQTAFKYTNNGSLLESTTSLNCAECCFKRCYGIADLFGRFSDAPLRQHRSECLEHGERDSHCRVFPHLVCVVLFQWYPSVRLAVEL